MSDDERPNQDELLAQFQSITGTDVERSRFYLESSNWKLDLAISAFFENDNNDGAGGGQEAAQPPPRPNEDEDDEPMEASSAAAAPAKKDKKKSKPVPTSGEGRIATMASMIKAQEEGGSDSGSDSEEEQGQAFYAGGSTTSGQQILGPPKKKGSEFVSELFKRAREAGAEAVEGGGPGPSGSGGARGGGAFSGAGFKLGSDASTPAEVAVGQSSSSAESSSSHQHQPREFALKMWANGFSIDDGELRPYNAPENRQFLASVMSGQIPGELVREARGGEVHVNMEDHKTEEFVRPKATQKPFQGQGMMLGGVTPSFTAASATPPAPVAASSSAYNAASESRALERFPVTADDESTTVQVRLADGSRLVVKMNVGRTVGELREYVTVARPAMAARQFTLATTFPNRQLDDDKVTLKDAGLLSAAIMLRLS